MHLLAIAGIAIIAIIPVSLGMTLFAPIRTRDKLKTFISAPLAFITAVFLIVVGWGDWPDIPEGWVNDKIIYNAVFGLGAVGIVLGLLEKASSHKQVTSVDQGGPANGRKPSMPAQSER